MRFERMRVSARERVSLCARAKELFIKSRERLQLNTLKLANGDAFTLFLSQHRLASRESYTRKSQTINYSDFSLCAGECVCKCECVWKVFNFNYKAAKKNDCFWTKVSVVPSLDDESWPLARSLKCTFSTWHCRLQRTTTHNRTLVQLHILRWARKNAFSHSFTSVFARSFSHIVMGFRSRFALFFSHKTHIFRFMQNLFTR